MTTAFASPTPSRLGETNAVDKTSVPPLDDAERDEFFDRLYRQHARAAWGVAHAVLRNADDASDAVAEAWARVLRSRPSPDNFRPYLLTAVRNAAIDIRRRSRHLDAGVDVDRPDPRQPIDGMLANEDVAVVNGAFAQLPERWRSALWLIDVEEVTTSEAAAVLGVSPNNAAQLAKRARSRLREEYLQAHVPNHVLPRCRETAELLGRYAAGGASPRTTRKVEKHLAGCEACTARLAELDDLGLKLRRALPPIPLVLRPAGGRGSRQRLAEWCEQAAAAVIPSPAVTTTITQLVAASPLLERLAAGAAATVLVVGVSTLAVRSPDPAPPSARGAVAEVVNESGPGEPALEPPPGRAPLPGPGPGPGAVGAGAAVLAGSLSLPAETSPGAGPPTAPAVGPLGPGVAAAAPTPGLAVPPAALPPAALPPAALPPAVLPPAPPVQLAPLGSLPALAPLPAPAPLPEPRLRIPDVRGADLAGLDLRGADLRGADLRNRYLRGADLRGADLRNADLTGADLSLASLEGADVSGAKLGGANLTGANLTGADLTGIAGAPSPGALGPAPPLVLSPPPPALDPPASTGFPPPPSPAVGALPAPDLQLPALARRTR